MVICFPCISPVRPIAGLMGLRAQMSMCNTQKRFSADSGAIVDSTNGLSFKQNRTSIPPAINTETATLGVGPRRAQHLRGGGWPPAEAGN